MKRFISLFLCVLLVFSLSGTAMADDGQFSHFLTLNKWSDDIFSDVNTGDWFYDNVKSVYRMGLMNGTASGVFSPYGSVTRAEAIALSARIHSLFTRAHTEFDASDPWYNSYVAYAQENKIVTRKYDNYNAPITRSDFAVILSRALPEELLPAINTVENGSIPDVPYAKSCAGAVYRLYRAGILSGSGADGSFLPETGITRAEAAAVAGRMTMESQRVTLTLTAPEKDELSGEEIFAKCSSSVFYIDMLDEFGVHTANGSGFFIDSEGTAVTCWHVLENGVSARILLPGSKKEYKLEGVYDYSTLNDWALIKVNPDGDKFSFLDIGDAKTNVGGATVYAFGSPLGIQNTITQGLICNPLRVEDGTDFILFSAAISRGSSGGALITKYGEAIGITAASYVYGENLNLAINLSYLDSAYRDTVTPLPEVIAAEKAHASPSDASGEDAPETESPEGNAPETESPD